MEPLLSILICTMPSRLEMYKCLWGELRHQINALPRFLHKAVEIRCDPDMGYSVGIKRQKLLEQAAGIFIVYIDDDDMVSPVYISEILSAIIRMPHADCIGINGMITEDGANRKKWIISVDYPYWHENNECYFRTPNHISPVRRSIALQAGFPDKTHGEDHDYSMRIKPLLKWEIKIVPSLYHYRFMKNK